MNAQNLQPELSIPELEKRMRPGAHSSGGFLGQGESLEAVIAADDRTLQALGLSHEQVAAALEKVLVSVCEQRDYLLRQNYTEYSQREWGDGKPDVYRSRAGPRFDLDDLPDTEVGYLAGERLQVFFQQYRGLQECPWDCEYDPWSSFDFLVLNRRTGSFLAGPGLIMHLIRAHHFFEGPESPYRVDPSAAAETLEL